MPDDIPNGLVNAKRLAEILFPDPDSRPAERTVKEWTAKRVISSLKIGGRRFYDPVKVRAELDRKFEIQAM